ncbi:MAG TPA: (5-formylfuran-3-yl)methyl phosphate synthase [Solirubrobacteraceae bacterium]
MDAAEAAQAVDAGVDIIDLKDPAEGSLGAPRPDTIRQVRRAVPDDVPVSVAIGDMPHLPGTAALAARGAADCGAAFVKVGLWGSPTEAEAVELLRAVRDAVADRPGVAVIAAAYADAERLPSRPLPPLLIARVARAAEVAGCLIDTGVKDGRGLLQWLAPAVIAQVAAEAHAADLHFALAGSLGLDDLRAVRSLRADIVGVRSAACRDGRRDGALDLARVRRLRAVCRA